MVICLERVADLHMAQLMPLPRTVSCFSKIQIGFTFLVPAYLGSRGQRAVKRVCVLVCAYMTSPRRILLGSQHRRRPQLWRRQLSIDICCPRPGCGKLQSAIDGQKETNQQHVAAAVDLRERQTDGQTDTRPLHRRLLRTMGMSPLPGGR